MDNVNHCIELDSDEACELGFTSDKFLGYLWRENNTMYISAIMSIEQNKGHLRALFETLQAKGFDIKVPVPLPQMRAILKRWQFKETQEPNPIDGEPYLCAIKKHDDKIPQPNSQAINT